MKIPTVKIPGVKVPALKIPPVKIPAVGIPTPKNPAVKVLGAGIAEGGGLRTAATGRFLGDICS